MLENIYTYFFGNISNSDKEGPQSTDESKTEEWIFVLNDDKNICDSDSIDNYSLDIYIDETKDASSYKFIDTISSRIGNAILPEKRYTQVVTKYYPIYLNCKPPTSKQVTLYFQQDPINEIIDQSYLYNILDKKNSQWSPVIKEPIFNVLKQLEWKDKYENSKINMILQDNPSIKQSVQLS
uniref:ZirS_C domain-containing protein n=1 Tax=Strongyloides venezuelensis TaxID=75913 RepID=A0A0K0FYM5_STRVS